jgi:hypothetical protein
VIVTRGSADRLRRADWGEAVTPALCYRHPGTGADVEVHQPVRVPRDLPSDLTISERVDLVCGGVMLSGMLRHPFLLITG